ncbi:MAG: hypothetical protein AB8H86_05760 [Polyangiales bacterium]
MSQSLAHAVLISAFLHVSLGGASAQLPREPVAPESHSAFEGPGEELTVIASVGHALVDLDLGPDESVSGGGAGPLSLTVELQALIGHHFGVGIIPLRIQQSTHEGERWRLASFGIGPRIQLLPSSRRAEVTLSYDIAYLRTKKLGLHRHRHFASHAHSVSLRLDNPLPNSRWRLGVRMELGMSSTGTRWVNLAFSMSYGSRQAPRRGTRRPRSSRRTTDRLPRRRPVPPIMNDERRPLL